MVSPNALGLHRYRTIERRMVGPTARHRGKLDRRPMDTIASLRQTADRINRSAQLAFQKNQLLYHFFRHPGQQPYLPTYFHEVL